MIKAVENFAKLPEVIKKIKLKEWSSKKIYEGIQVEKRRTLVQNHESIPMGQQKWTERVLLNDKITMKEGIWKNIWKIVSTLKIRKLHDIHDGLYKILTSRYVIPVNGSKYKICENCDEMKESSPQHILYDCEKNSKNMEKDHTKTDLLTL